MTSSTMWLQATIAHEDLTHYLNELLPLRMSFAQAEKPDEPARIVELGVPRHIEIVPAKGVRIETHARIQWPVLGLNVPATVRSIQVLFAPRLEDRDGAPALAFGLEIEKLDVSMVPGIVEGAIIEVINAELAQQGVLPAWEFTKTLDFRFAAPTQLGIEGQIRLYASWADLKINDDGITLAMSFRAGLTREDTFELEQPTSDPPAPTRTTAAATPALATETPAPAMPRGPA